MLILGPGDEKEICSGLWISIPQGGGIIAVKEAKKGLLSVFIVIRDVNPIKGKWYNW